MWAFLISHLHYTLMGHTGHFWACVLGCSGGSDLPQCRRCSLQDMFHTVSVQNGRTPLDRHVDTDPERGIWPCQTYLDGARQEKEICAGNVLREQELKWKKKSKADAQNKNSDKLRQRVMHVHKPQNRHRLMCLITHTWILRGNTFSPDKHFNCKSGMILERHYIKVLV